MRKVLGKKLKKKIPEIRNEFIYGKGSIYDEDHNVIGMSNEPSPYCEGGLARGYSQELCDKMFDNMEAFAKYSFNRSHSFCYAVIAYKTAWLSYYYPAEFAIANCTINENQESITQTLSLAKRRKISILPPDINHSEIGFSMDNGAIRYGLKAIKGVGSSVLNFIDQYRKLDPVPFKDFDDYYNRIHDSNNPIVIQLINDLRAKTGKNSPNPMKKDVELSLILAGAFDYSEKNRYKLVYHYIREIRKEKGDIKVMDKKFTLIDPAKCDKEYKRKEKLALEKFYMGSYISEHPLDSFPYADFDLASDNEVVKTSGIVSEVILKMTKTGKPYLAIKIRSKDDIDRTVNVFDTNKVDSLKNDLKKNQIIIITGKISKKYNNINASSIKIAAFKKQLDTESLDIKDNTQNTPVPQIQPSSDVGYGNIF